MLSVWKTNQFIDRRHYNSRSVALSCFDWLLPIGTQTHPENTTLSKNCCLGNPNFLHLAIQFFVYGGHSLDKKDIYCSLKFIASNHITLTRPIYIYFITDVQWFYILEKNLLLIYSVVEYKIINLKHHLMDACSSNVDKPFQECILSIP